MEPTELQTAFADLKTVLEQHFGKVETTDFAGAWQELAGLVNPPEPATQEPDTATEEEK